MALASKRNRSWATKRLGEVLVEVNVRASSLPHAANGTIVLSLTKNSGLIPQTDRFDKRIATLDVSRYKVVRRDWLVYNPYVLWEGAIHALRNAELGLVSPVYHVWESQEASAPFLDYLLKTPEMLNAYLRVAQGTVKRRRAVRTSAFKKLPIQLPPLSEQQAIARVLDAVQQSKMIRQRELALERERKATLMEYLFTHGTRGELTKQTEIGEMPKNWELPRLRQVFKTQLGKMLSQKARRGNNQKPYLRNANVQWGRLNLRDLYEMDFTTAEQEKFRLCRDDVLICEGGEIGRTAIWKGELPECYFQKAIHRLRPSSEAIIPQFLLFWMEWAFRFANIYGVTGTKTTIAHLPQEKLEELKLPQPEKEEQREIVSVLDACDSKISNLNREITLLAELFQAMLEELMTGRLSAAPLIEEHLPQ